MTALAKRVLLAAMLVATVGAALFPIDEADVVVPASRSKPAVGAIGTATAAAAPVPTADPLTSAAGHVSTSGTQIAPPGPGAGIAILDLARLRRAPSVIEGKDPFILPPPPAPPPPPPEKKIRKVVVAPPPPPQAPPLPFRMIGSVDEDGKLTIFASRENGDVVAMRVADIIDNVYRIEAINAQTMILTYLPLGQKQTLPLGEAPR